MASAEPRAWFGGRIYTGRGWAEALLVERGTIVAVGTDDEVRRAAGAGTERVGLAGRLVIPGLIDAHLHWLGSVVDAAGIDLRGGASIGELQRRIEAGRDRSGVGPLLGAGWDQERLVDGRYPVRADLDRIESRRPVVLYRICHHAAVVNSAALETLHITRDTPDPSGGRIGRDADGEPNGLLFDRAMRDLRGFSAASFAARASEATGFLDTLAGRGLTSVGAMSAVPDEWELARQTHARQPLPVRLRLHLIAEQWDRRAPGLERDPRSPRLVGLKIVLDGSLGARTAWLDEPYADAPGERGMPLTSEEKAGEIGQAAAAQGLGIAMHAIGDRAVSAALRAASRLPPGAPTPRIEHASVLSAALVDHVAEQRPILVVQPSFVASDTWVAERLGAERAQWTYPFSTLLHRGIVVAGSSDAPIESFDPWSGLRVAVNQCGLAPEAALGLYTAGAAAALHDSTLGTIAPGRAADFVIVDAPDVGAAIRAGGPITETWCGGVRTASPGAATSAI